MRKKAAILVTACIVVVSVVVFYEFFVSKTPVQQTSTDTTVINGVTYSTSGTPYGIFTIRFLDFLPDGSMEGHAKICWLLYPNQPTPPKVVAEPSNTPQNLGFPGPLADVMIDGWLYSRTPTNFTKFIYPPSTIPLWTETPNEPIPVASAHYGIGKE